MYLRTILIVAMLGLLAVFVLLNWNALVAVTPVSLGFTFVEAPLGLILLGFTGVLTALFLIYLVYWQSSALMEQRRQAREVQTQRELAENAEASRFQQLQSYLQSELAELEERTDAAREALLARLEQMEREIRGAIERSGDSLAAYLGEIEDRLERSGGGENE